MKKKGYSGKILQIYMQSLALLRINLEKTFNNTIKIYYEKYYTYNFKTTVGLVYHFHQFKCYFNGTE